MTIVKLYTRQGVPIPMKQGLGELLIRVKFLIPTYLNKFDSCLKYDTKLQNVFDKEPDRRDININYDGNCTKSADKQSPSNNP